jgi:2-oxoglutarate ferredoxin oxidoreductase subunit alpha
MPAFNEGYRLLIDGQLHSEDGNRAGHLPDVCAQLTERLCRKITGHREEIYDLETHFLDDAERVVVCFGSPARPALRAVKDARERGVRAGYMKIRTIWPFPEEAIAALAGKARTLIVPELNVGRVVQEVRRVTAGRTEVVSLPKLGGLLHTPDEILAELTKRRRP